MAKDQNEEIQRQQPPAESVKPANPMANKVPVALPRAAGTEEDFVFVGLNGKGYTIKRGITVMVPEPVAEIVMESQRAEARQQEFIQKMREISARPFEVA